jgi:hypothetical protein
MANDSKGCSARFDIGLECDFRRGWLSNANDNGVVILPIWFRAEVGTLMGCDMIYQQIATFKTGRAEMLHLSEYHTELY